MQNAEGGESGNFEPGFWEKFKKWVEKYARHYSDAKFRKKIEKFFKKAGRAVLKPALTLFHAAQDANTPDWARAIMIGALGYFIFPVDAIPDLTPVAGYTDDLLVLVKAIVVVAAHITEEHIKKAEESLNQIEEFLNRWFGEDD